MPSTWKSKFPDEEHPRVFLFLAYHTFSIGLSCAYNPQRLVPPISGISSLSPCVPILLGSFPRRYIPEPCLKGPRECPTPMALARLMAMVRHTLGTSGKRRTLPELSSAQHPTVRLQVHPYIRPNLLHTICHSRGYRCSVFPMYGRIDQSREHKEQHQVGTRGPHHDHVLIYHAIHRI